VALVEARGVWREFGSASGPSGPGGGGVVALRDIDLAVEAGEFVVVTGPSGSGKSTLLAVLGGLDPPTRGEVVLDGTSLYRRTARALTVTRARDIGFVFQDFALISHLSALENVRLPQLFAHGPDEERSDRARGLLERLHLAHRWSHKPDELSRGEMQRVALARALVNRPRLVLADEPTANLDRANAKAFLDELATLVGSEGLTVVLAAHREDWFGSASRIVRLEAGRLVADDRTGGTVR
jgi:putative ABC transport system ATP-binding protein